MKYTLLFFLILTLCGNRVAGQVTVTQQDSKTRVSTDSSESKTAATIKNATKIKDSKSENVINIYPNPVIDYFMISDNPNLDKVVIYNIIGRQMRTYKVVEGTKYYVNDLPDGIYIIRLMNANGGTLKTTRLSKTRVRA